MILEQLTKDIEAEESPEKALRLGITLMRTALSQEGAPRFKDFWHVRQFCLPLFKRTLNSSVRTQLWKEFAELSTEARQLREILEEKATFAFEQLELAIRALEEETKRDQELIDQIPLDDITQGSKFLGSKAALYSSLDREFYLYDAFATRVRSLRDEMARAEMRLRHKNRLFDRLKVSGDHIFSRKKEICQKLSHEFDSDVRRFLEEGLSKETPLFSLKEEIKVLQAIGKHRAISLPLFRDSREKLSHFWNQLKELEKEKKREFSEKKQQQEEEQRARREKEETRKNQFKNLKNALHELIDESEKKEAEVLIGLIKEKRAQFESLSLLLVEKQELEPLFETLYECVRDQREKALLSSSELQTLKELHIQLEERKKQRDEVKAQLENCRKILGGSGLDFHKAMHYREQMQREKERLVKVEASIQELEEKIDETD